MLTPPRLGRFANFFGCFLTGYNNSEAMRATLQRPASFLSGCSFPSGCSLPSRYNTKRGNSREPPSSSRKRSFAINKTLAVSLVLYPHRTKMELLFSALHRASTKTFNPTPHAPTVPCTTPCRARPHTRPLTPCQRAGARPPSSSPRSTVCVCVSVCESKR